MKNREVAALVIVAVVWNTAMILLLGKYPKLVWIFAAVNVLLLLLTGRPTRM